MMQSNDFEDAFSQFLARHEYDEAENYLFSMVRISFAAGWRAAGGDPPRGFYPESGLLKETGAARREGSFCQLGTGGHRPPLHKTFLF